MKTTGEMARRVFLRCAGLLAALPLGARARRGAAAEGHPERTAARLDELTCADFTPHVGAMVSIESDSAQSLRARLVEARALGKEVLASSPRRAPFSLIFEGPRGPRLEQGTRRVAFDGLGTLTLFLVPIGRPEQVTRYQAVFG